MLRMLRLCERSGSLGLILPVTLAILVAGSASGQTWPSGNVSSPVAMQQSTQPPAERAYERGMQLLESKQYREALRQFELLAKMAPQRPYGLAGEGVTFALLGQPMQAIDKLKKALVLSPDFWVARRELGIVYWHQNMQEQAAKELIPIAQMFPNDAPTNLILGQYYFKRQKYQRALQCFSNAPAQVVRKPDLSLMQAAAYLKTGERKQAARILDQLALRPDLSNRLRFKLAWLQGEAQDYKAAIKVFDSLPADYPDAFHRKYGVALAYYEDGQYANCIRALKSLRSQRDLRPQGFSLLGVAEEKSGQTKEAYDTFREGILNYPDNPQNYMNISTLAAQHYNYGLAEQILTSGIERIPQSHELYLSRGIIYTLEANFSAAEKDYVHSIQMDPGDSQGYFSLGLCLLEKGELSASVQAFKKSAVRKPNDPQPFYFIAEALIEKGVEPGTPAFRSAQKALETAISLYPDFALAYRDRAKLELASGNADKALIDLKRAHTFAPKSRSIRYLLAQTYLKLGDGEKARKLFAEVSGKGHEDAKDFRRDSLTRTLVIISKSPKRGSVP